MFEVVEPDKTTERFVHVGSFYRHFKGGIYKVEAIARNVDNDKPMVVYKNIDTGKLYARDLVEFMSEVPKDRNDWMGQKFRFVLLQEKEVKVDALAESEEYQELKL